MLRSSGVVRLWSSNANTVVPKGVKMVLPDTWKKIRKNYLTQEENHGTK